MPEDPVETNPCSNQCVIEWPQTTNSDTRFAAHWYAVHTCSRREKQVARVFSERGIENLLPLYQRKQSRRRSVVSWLPLFPGYVLVRILLREYLCVLQVPGVVRLVSFHGRPAEIDDDEIHAIRIAMQKGLNVQPHPYVKIGKLVEIHCGALQGTRGHVIRRNKNLRVVLSVEALGQSIVVEVNEEDLGPSATVEKQLAAA
jgi:transcription antitermination factor NusG